MNRKYTVLALQFILGTVALVLLLRFNLKRSFDGENFALGTATSSHFANVDKALIHVNKINDKEAQTAITAYKASSNLPVMLILGNSQTHSINQFQPGQTTYVEMLHRQIKDSYVMAHSIQNASLQYFLISLEYFSSKVTIDKVVLPVFFDDFREDGIRDIFFTDVINEHFLLDSVSGAKSITDINNELKSYWNKTTTDSTSDIYRYTQDLTEEKLEDFLASRSTFWEQRPDLRGNLFLDLYQLRNRVFNINAQTVRNKIPARYEKNMMVFGEIIRFCDEQNIELYVYIPPLRNDVTPPYNLNDYAIFKQEIDTICKQHQVDFINLESIVPGKYWGMKNSTNGTGELEYDFMHFQYPGHQLLGSSLLHFIEK